MPFTAASAGGVTAEASAARESPEKSSRQPCSCAVSAAGRPSTVIPLTPSAFPTLPRIRTHRHRLRPSRERGVPRERRSVEHGDERLQVLADDDVERNGERRLVALGLDERGAIPLGEEREGEGEREEGDRDGGRARATAERHGCETRADAAVEQPAGEPDERAEEPRRRDGGGERDQARQEEQDETGVLALGEPRLVGGAAEQRSDDERDRADSGDVEQAEAALGPGRHRRGDRDDQRREHDDARREREPGRRENALAEHGTDGSACAARRQRSDDDADEPADQRAGDGDDRALGDGEEPQLPAPRAVPGEPPPGRLEIAPHAPRREHREGEEQRRRLAADEQQPPPGDGGRLLRRPELLDRSLHAVADRVAGQSAARACSLLATRPSISQSRGRPAASGHTQA